METSIDSRHLRNVITNIIDDEGNEDCPRPARLRALLRPSTSDDSIPNHRVCPYGLCPGDGWQVHYSLHTRGRLGTIRDSITAEQVETLRHTLDPKKQAIYDAVSPCRCNRNSFHGVAE